MEAKTLWEWTQSLPQHLRVAALNEQANHPADKLFASLSDAITLGIRWTPDLADLWEAVVDRIEAGEFNSCDETPTQSGEVPEPISLGQITLLDLFAAAAIASGAHPIESYHIARSAIKERP